LSKEEITEIMNSLKKDLDEANNKLKEMVEKEIKLKKLEND